MSNGFGQTGGFLTVGEVVNVKDDPTQSGRVKVMWHLGAVSQNQLQESDLPWTQCLFPPTNPSNKNTGGPHHGLQIGTKVYGVPVDPHGQDFIIIGTVPRAGTGSPDQQPNYDSDTPHPSKVQQNNGVQQPKYGDKNSVVTQDSIWQFGQQQGGKDNVATLYDTLKDSIGMVSSITEQPMGNGGAGGVDALLGKLAGGGNVGGAFLPGPNLLQQLEGKIKNVPFALTTPGMSGVISSGNIINGLTSIFGSITGIQGLGNLTSLLGGLSTTFGNIQNMTPQQLAQMAISTISTGQLTGALGSLGSITASLSGL